MSEAKLCGTCVHHPGNYRNVAMCAKHVTVGTSTLATCPGPDFGCMLHEPKPADPFVEWIDSELASSYSTQIYEWRTRFLKARKKYLELKYDGKL